MTRTRWVRIGFALQVVLAGALGVATIWDPTVAAWWLVCVSALASAALLRTHHAIDGLRRVLFRHRIGRRRRPIPVPQAFDLATATDTRTPAAHAAPLAALDSAVGARWVEGTLVTAIALKAARPRLLRLSVEQPPQPYPAFITPLAGQTVGYSESIGLDILAELLSVYDIPLESIDIISQEVRARGPERLARTYGGLVGPLRWSSERTVLAVLRLNPMLCPDAIARRGGGSIGTQRAASVTTRRVARRLAEAGVDVEILTAARLTQATLDLNHGVASDMMTEHWHGATIGRL